MIKVTPPPPARGDVLIVEDLISIQQYLKKLLSKVPQMTNLVF